MGHGYVKAFGEILSPAKVFESSRDLRLTLTHRGVVSHIGAKPLEVIGVHKPLVLSNVAFLVYRIDNRRVRVEYEILLRTAAVDPFNKHIGQLFPRTYETHISILRMSGF